MLRLTGKCGPFGPERTPERPRFGTIFHMGSNRGLMMTFWRALAPRAHPVSPSHPGASPALTTPLANSYRHTAAKQGHSAANHPLAVLDQRLQRGGLNLSAPGDELRHFVHDRARQCKLKAQRAPTPAAWAKVCTLLEPLWHPTDGIGSRTGL